MDKWVDFFERYFENRDDAKDFVIGCEAPTEQRTMLMMHQTQRLISLANDIDKIRPGRDSLRLLFLIICAEAVAKLYKNFQGEGKVKEHIYLFFEEFCTGEDKKKLNGAFNMYPNKRNRNFTREDAVTCLYKIRCAVVHNGKYWDFQFNKPNLNTTASKSNWPEKGEVLFTTITYEEFRDIVVRCAINSMRKIIYSCKESI